MYAIYGNIYHPYTPNFSIYTIHGSYGIFATSITIKSLFFDISVALTCQIARFRVHLEKSRSGVNKKVPRLFEKKAVIWWFPESRSILDG